MVRRKREGNYNNLFLVAGLVVLGYLLFANQGFGTGQLTREAYAGQAQLVGSGAGAGPLHSIRDVRERQQFAQEGYQNVIVNPVESNFNLRNDLCGNGRIDPGEQCGEPRLRCTGVLGPGQQNTCDRCRCRRVLGR